MSAIAETKTFNLSKISVYVNCKWLPDLFIPACIVYESIFILDNKIQFNLVQYRSVTTSLCILLNS